MRKTPKKIKTAMTQLERLARKCEEVHSGDMSKMTRTEQNSVTKHGQTAEEYFVSLPEQSNYERMAQSKAREFWRNEYLKRKFFLEAKETGCSDFTTHELFLAIAEWRIGRDKTIENSDTDRDCKRARCRFNCKSKAGKQSLKYPFFYSRQACHCDFTDSINFSVTCWHNQEFPHIETAIQLSDNLGFYNNIDTWPPEFTHVVETIHRYSYRYGQFGQDLFSLTSPMELIKRKGRIRFPGHTEPFLLEGDEECDPRLMQIMRIDPKTNTVLKKRAENFKNYELHVGVNLTTSEISLKKEVARIKKALETCIQGEGSKPDAFATETDSIIFSYNPSAKSFSIDKALITSKLAMGSYLAICGQWNTLEEDYQVHTHEKLNYITSTKNYQSKNIKRAIGLYIWDQVHYLSVPRNNVIRSLINSKLFETAMNLSGEAAQLRELVKEDKVEGDQEAIGSQAEYVCVSKYYQLAEDCIRSGKLLTEAESKRLRSP